MALPTGNNLKWVKDDDTATLCSYCLKVEGIERTETVDHTFVCNGTARWWRSRNCKLEEWLTKAWFTRFTTGVEEAHRAITLLLGGCECRQRKYLLMGLIHKQAFKACIDANPSIKTSALYDWMKSAAVIGVIVGWAIWLHHCRWRFHFQHADKEDPEWIERLIDRYCQVEVNSYWRCKDHGGDSDEEEKQERENDMLEALGVSLEPVEGLTLSPSQSYPLSHSNT